MSLVTKQSWIRGRSYSPLDLQLFEFLFAFLGPGFFLPLTQGEPSRFHFPDCFMVVSQQFLIAWTTNETKTLREKTLPGIIQVILIVSQSISTNQEPWLWGTGFFKIRGFAGKCTLTCPTTPVFVELFELTPICMRLDCRKISSSYWNTYEELSRNLLQCLGCMKWWFSLLPSLVC